MHIIPSNAEYEILQRKPDLTQAEVDDLNRILARMRMSATVPIDPSAPLCRAFVPDPHDEPSLIECERRSTPEALFPPQWNRGTFPMIRYIHIRDRNMVLLQTDGACLDNGGRQPSAGYGLVCGPPLPGYPDHGVLSVKLPPADATSNRAELIAVIAVLGGRIWAGEGFDKVVVATDSEYVVKGCTERCRKWQARNWKTSAGQPVKNKDLWEELIWTVEEMMRRQCEVLFWQIPREWNSKADAAAKRAAAREETESEK